MSQMGDWLDGILADGLQTYIENNRNQLTTPASLKMSEQDLAKLRTGKDPFYDVPGIGAAYGMTYHPARMNDGMRGLIPAIQETCGGQKNVDSISLIDLGCGTGVGLWALTSLLEAGRRGWLEDLEGCGMPGHIHYLGLDSSPFMIDAAKALWEKCGNLLSPEIPVSAHFRMCNWPVARTSIPAGEITRNRWLMASFLFDFDMANEEPGTGDVKKSFSEVTGYFQPDFIFLLSSTAKKKCTREISEKIQGLKYPKLRESFRPQKPLSGGPLHGSLVKTLILTRKHLPSFFDPNWNSKKPTHVEFLGRDGQKIFSPEVAMPEPPFDPKQVQAANLGAIRKEGPRVIVGPPGSGKTLILYDLLLQMLEEGLPQAGLTLFVCFNKAIIDQIFLWHQAGRFPQLKRKPSSKWKSPASGNVIIERDGKVIARLLNFDKLPTQIGGLPPPSGGSFDAALFERFKDWKTKNPEISFDKIKSEFRVHYYGKAMLSVEEYLNIDRNKATGLRLAKGTHLRRETGELFRNIQDQYLKNRIHLLQEIRRQKVPPRFCNVLIDELQDMTDLDLEILRGLALRNATLVAAEDAAQNIHTGRFYRRPKLKNDHIWHKKTVETCYRTPYRIGIALKKISEALDADVQKASELEEGVEERVAPGPTRLSFTGIRPILIQGESLKKVSEIICVIIRNIDAVGDSVNKGLIMQTNKDLQAALSQKSAQMGLQINWDTKGILAAKGLECPVVVWDTGSVHPRGSEPHSLGYTIISRATTICVIWERTGIKPKNQKLLRQLTDQEVLLWPNSA